MSTEKRMSVSVTNAARRICLPVDGSAHSSKAVEWYLAELYKPGDFIIFVHSLEAPNLPTVTVGAGLSLPIDSWTKALQENKAVEWYLAELYKPGDFIIFVHSLEAPNLPTVTVGAGLSLPIDSWTKALQE
ncbi:hypothetical protein T265_12941, partial [Opisthorchis viverrini]